MTNTTQAELDARHAAAEMPRLRAVIAERQGRYTDAAALFDQVAAIYGADGSTYAEMAERCRAFAAGKTFSAKGRKRGR